MIFTWQTKTKNKSKNTIIYPEITPVINVQDLRKENNKVSLSDIK